MAKPISLASKSESNQGSECARWETSNHVASQEGEEQTSQGGHSTRTGGGMGYGGKRVHCIKIEPENERERKWVARKDKVGVHK